MRQAHHQKVLVNRNKLFRLIREKVQAETSRYQSDNVLLLRHYMAGQARMAEVADSMRYARHLHDALLPDELQLRQLTGEAFALNLPKDTLSGDFFWFTRAGSKLVIALADCTGHGVPGALMSVLGLSLLNQVVLEERTYEPSHILRRLDYKLKLTFQHSGDSERKSYDGMDIALCTVDYAEGKLHFAGAMRPAYIAGEQLRILKGARYPIGGLRLEADRTYASQSVPFEKGEMLYLFSDGIVDQFGGNEGRKFTPRRLRTLLQEAVSKPTSVQKQRLHESFVLWKGMQEQTDDAMIIGVRL